MQNAAAKATTPTATGTNGANPSMRDKLQVAPLPAITWVDSLRHILPHREDLIVAGREIKGGFVIHPIIASAILGLMVTLGIAVRSELNWQHDQLVILTTQRDDDQKAASAAREAARQEQELARLWREKYDQRMARVEDKLKSFPIGEN